MLGKILVVVVKLEWKKYIKEVGMVQLWNHCKETPLRVMVICPHLAFNIQIAMRKKVEIKI